MQRLVARLAGAVAQPGDSREDRIRKSLLCFLAAMSVVAGALWGAGLYLLDYRLQAAIPAGYALLVGSFLLYCSRSKQFHVFLYSQLVLILILPLCLQFSLGGFSRSGAVVLWSILSPIGALMFEQSPRLRWWFIGFAAALILAGLGDRLAADHGPVVAEPVRLGLYLMNFVGVSAIFLILVRYSLHALQKARAEVEIERERSDGLLLNILPPSIAERLKGGESPIADGYDEVTVIFADIVGFTPLSDRFNHKPETVVGMLNELFSAFDDLSDRCGLEKIRTIGDNYMAVAGAPIPRADHARITAEMALSMLDVVCSYDSEPMSLLDVRIGINTGPAVAGVIGKRKFVYDIYGDTVNTASRMESQGLRGEIQVTESTYRRLRDHYIFEERGAVDVKGKGQMMTYLLKGRKTESTGHISRALNVAHP